MKGTAVKIFANTKQPEHPSFNGFNFEYNERIRIYPSEELTESMTKSTQISNEDLMFLMTNLRPKRTGLPMIIWISEDDETGQVCNIKVQMVHGNKSDAFNWVLVTVSNEPKIIGEITLSDKDFAAVKKYILLNQEAIMKYWNHETCTSELLDALVKLEK